MNQTKLFLVVMLFTLGSAQLYYCTVDNCLACSFYNTCGVCENNYVIMMDENGGPYCQQVLCTMDNCQTCLVDNMCQVCSEGFFPQSDGSCGSTDMSQGCSNYCLTCSEEEGCSRCEAGYSLQKGHCFPTIELPANCTLAFNSAMCQVCKPGHYLYAGYKCIEYSMEEQCNVENCYHCISNNNCSVCAPGYTEVDGACQTIDCGDVENCMSCDDNSTCLECLPNYQLVDEVCMLKSYPCQDTNCAQCVSEPNICSTCNPGYYPYSFFGNGASATICLEINSFMLSNPLANENCMTLGVIPMQIESTLTYGCIQCNTGFLMMGGFCVAAIDNSISCNVDNCASCVLPNYCNMCNEGYYVPRGAGGICVKKYSPVATCAWVSQNAICEQCIEGYALSYGLCQPYNSATTCNVEGCAYCLGDDTCQACQQGFEVVNDGGEITCQALCDVTECMVCESISTCSLCNYGFMLSEDNTDCLSVSDEDNATLCSDVYGQHCETCNQMNCLSCEDGFVYDTYTHDCCDTGSESAYMMNMVDNCMKTKSQCNSTCIRCNIGYIMSEGNCVGLPCEIENCAYCYRSSVCIVCEQGFTLNSETSLCEAYTMPANCANAAHCTECTDGACTACVNGYVIFEGTCVCDFQNCLECMGGAFCTNCTWPSIPAYENGGGCIPMYTVNLCNVENCAECFGVNQCSLCAVGYYLDENGVCILNSCSDPQCSLCDNSNTFCYLCAEGYMPDQLFGKNCVEIPMNYSCAVVGCAVCNNGNADSCETCDEQYTLQENGTCSKIQCSENCMFCIAENTCTYCSPGFFLSAASASCEPHNDSSTVCTEIENCLSCIHNDEDQLQCLVCGYGLQPSEDYSSCVPQVCDIWGCQICTNAIIPTDLQTESSGMTQQICLFCQQGYFRNSYLQCVSYTPEPSTVSCQNIYNCIYCANNQSCSLCAEGWQEMNGVCATNLYCGVDNCAWCSNPTTCVQCSEQYILSEDGSTCTPDCQINNCQVCQDLTHCQTCADPFIQSDDNTLCVCKQTYQQIDNTCACSNTSKQFGGSCYECTIQFCDYCTSNQTCGECLEGFNLQPQEGICECPYQFTQFNSTCVECMIDFCTQCQTENECSQCSGDLFPVYSNESGENVSLCGCPRTYEQTNNTCSCPNNTIQNDGVCYACTLSWCSLCSADEFCAEDSCFDTFENNNGTCVCPQGTQMFEGVCYDCDINNCESCHENSVCFECSYPFIVGENGTACVCPEGFLEQNGNECICPAGQFNNSEANNTCSLCSESIQYCAQCNSPEVCDTCQEPFILNNGSNGCVCPESYQQNGDNCQCPDGFNDFENVCYDCSGADYCHSCSQTNFCHQCFETFSPNENGACVCNDDSYVIEENTCICPNLTTEHNNSCIPCDLEFCISCEQAQVCSDCSGPFVPNENGNQCVCPETFIRDGSDCICPEGFYLHENSICLICNIENCHSCVSAEVCETCDPTFILGDGNVSCVCPESYELSTADNGSASTCVCPTGTSQFNDICVPCQVTFCNECHEENFCFECFETFLLNPENGECICRDSSYIIVNESTCECPSNTIEYESTCIVCEIEYCQYCTEPNMCGQCYESFNLINNTEDGTSSCQCDSNQKVWNDTCIDCDTPYCNYCMDANICSECMESFDYIEEDNICRCPTDYTLNMDDNTCYECQIDFCSLCMETGVCNTCLGELVPTMVQDSQNQNMTNSVCACPNSYEVYNDTLCQCPEGTTEFNNYCYLCSIDYCNSCQEDGVCSSCDESFVLDNETNTCVCPDDTTLYEGFCYSCDINFCELCQEDGFCFSCEAPFVVNQTSGDCVCPDTFFLNNQFVCVCEEGQFNSSSSQTCESCSTFMSYCAACSSQTVCTLCVQPFELTQPSENGEVSCQCPQTYINRNDNCTCPDGFSDFEGVCYECTSDPHCLSCSNTNFCSQCHDNFIPVNGSCVCYDDTYIVEDHYCVCPVTATEYNNTCVSCEIQFCTLCKVAGICSTCSSPFVLGTDGSSCVCPETYVQSGETCVCPTGFFEEPESSLCTECTLEYCSQCKTNSTCLTCNPSFITTEQGLCTCQQTYQPIDGVCSCPLGTIKHENVCYLCSSSNYCNYCTADNFCGECFDTFILNATTGVCSCLDETYEIVNGSVCQCPAQTILFNNTCVSCDISDCVYCQQNGVCQECYPGFVLSANGGQCTCPATFVIVTLEGNDTPVCQCPDGSFNVSNKCSSCGVANCETCDSATTCGACNPSFKLSSDQTICSCPDSTFNLTEGKCICPVNTTILNGQTCVPCSIEYCSLCQSAGVCENCFSTFLKVNNTCECNSPFVVIDNVCRCPINQTEFQGQCISCQVDGCELCEVSNICKTCSESYILVNNSVCQCPSGFTEYENMCYNCSNAQYCEVCSASNFCAQCASTFALNTTSGTCGCPLQTTLFNNTCVGCEIDNCGLCREENQCFSCQANYTLNDNYCLQCLIGNCQQCEIENVCGACSNGLQVSSNGNSCVLCEVQNCAICSGNNKCAACTGDFQLSASQTSCITCTQVPGCLSCSVDNVCSQCQAGYTLNLETNSCDVCSYPCKTCVIGNLSQCATCASPFSQQPASNGTCFTCTLPNCLTCSSTNTSVCTVCASGYRLQTNNTCVLSCVSNLCTSCADASICTACVAGYAPIGNNCTQCNNTPQCISCNSSNINQCTACNSGYYLQSNGVCKPCPSNCETCNSNGNGQCTKFKASTKQFGIRVNNQTVPAVCDSGCSLCSNENPSRCITCSSGFALQTDSTCLPCQSPCKTCASNNVSACLSCYGNAYLDSASNTCNMCTPSSNCLTCTQSNMTKCLTCPYGYSMSSSGTCIKGCPNNCLACSSSSVCTLCISGYAPNANGVCLPCLSNCRQCSSQANGVCLSCGPGFYLNQQQVCTACTAFCKTCSEIGCSECLPGYTVTPQFTCAKNCKSPCSTCSETNPTICTSCLAGYTFDETNSACQTVKNCPDGCNVCPLGFVLSNLECISCVGNCTRCQANSLSTCTSCADGAYVSNGICASCPEGCETCSSSQNCLSCSSGYTPLVEQVSTNMACVQCQYPCLQCIGNPDTCSECAAGFTLTGWKCISNFHFSLQLVFSVNPDQFYSNYEAFLNQIITALNAGNFNIVGMDSIKQGSTIVSATVNTDAASNSNDATSQFNGLSSALSTGTSIGGMQVESSSIAAVGGTIEQTQSGPNLALILGISIPCAVILIGIIAFCVFKKTRSQAPYDDPADSNRQVREQFELTNNIGGGGI